MLRLLLTTLCSDSPPRARGAWRSWRSCRTRWSAT